MMSVRRLPVVPAFVTVTAVCTLAACAVAPCAVAATRHSMVVPDTKVANLCSKYEIPDCHMYSGSVWRNDRWGSSPYWPVLCGWDDGQLAAEGDTGLSPPAVELARDAPKVWWNDHVNTNGAAFAASDFSDHNYAPNGYFWFEPASACTTDTQWQWHK